MATDEPFDAFDLSLKKKRKKKTVAFSEDPLGADADPTTPAPPLDDEELGPATVHERMSQNGRAADPEDAGGVDDLSDIKKKKKKKKEIPMDLVRIWHRCAGDTFSNLSRSPTRFLALQHLRRKMQTLEKRSLSRPSGKRRRKSLWISYATYCVISMHKSLNAFLLHRPKKALQHPS